MLSLYKTGFYYRNGSGKTEVEYTDGYASMYNPFTIETNRVYIINTKLIGISAITMFSTKTGAFYSIMNNNSNIYIINSNDYADCDQILISNFDENNPPKIFETYSIDKINDFYIANNNKPWISQNLVVDGGYLKMFKTIGVIGDSLSSGELEFKDNNGVLHYVDNYESSWLSNICRTIGATPIHYSEGGLTTKAWLQKYKTKLLNETNKPTCYFIALCTNDYGGVGGYGIGTIDDCYSDSAQTFIGYYGQIIRSIQTTQPKAKIFMLSSYARGTTQLQYSQAIEALSHKYSNTYYVDLYNLGSGLYDNNFYKNYGHFNDYGYVQVAKEIATICDKIIKDNYQSFKLATLIGTEFEQFIQLAQY